MKIVRPSIPHSPQGSGGGSHVRADWIRDWLANKGRYVALSCGHQTDLNHNCTTIIVRDDYQVICTECDDWAKVVKQLTLGEYVGLPPEPDYGDTPPF